MKARNVDPHSDIRDQPPTERDPYARGSFTWRRMQSWQAWTLAVAGVVLAIFGVMYVT
jgi:hypothetical protein